MRVILALVALAALGGHLFAQTAPSAADLAGRIQSRQTTIRDFTADFTQTTTSQFLTRSPEERGHVKVKKPGRIRQSYTTADHNEFVADGTLFYSFFRKDGFVTKAPLPPAEDGSLWSFLLGRGNLVRDFQPHMPPGQPPGEWHLILTSRTPQAQFPSLTLQVDRKSLQLRGLVVVDQQGTTSTYRFDNLKENVGLSDRDFEFKVPKGVLVQDTGR